MSKPIIAIDFDDTIAQTLRAIYHIGMKPFDKNSINDYFIPPNTFGIKEFYELLFKAHQSQLLLPNDYVISALTELDKTYDLYVLTSNTKRHIPFIEEWLNNLSINLPVKNSSSFQNKFDFKWDLLIDDHPQLNEMGKMFDRNVLQYPQPYNSGIKSITWKYIPFIVESKYC